MVLQTWVLFLISIPLTLGVVFLLFHFFKLEKKIPDNAWSMVGPLLLFGTFALIWLPLDRIIGPPSQRNHIAQLKKDFRQADDLKNYIYSLENENWYVKEQIQRFIIQEAHSRKNVSLVEALIDQVSDLDIKERAEETLVKINKEFLLPAQKILKKDCDEIIKKDTGKLAYSHRPDGHFVLLEEGKLLDKDFLMAGSSEVKEFLNEIAFVACIKERKEKVGTYKPKGGDAFIIHYKVSLVDRKNKVVSAEKEFSGKSPPSKSLYGMSLSGTPPSYSTIEKWILSLPTK